MLHVVPAEALFFLPGTPEGQDLASQRKRSALNVMHDEEEEAFVAPTRDRDECPQDPVPPPAPLLNAKWRPLIDHEELAMAMTRSKRSWPTPKPRLRSCRHSCKRSIQVQ